MKRIMVKKELSDGRPCDKCVLAEEQLKKRGVWEQIDEVIWAIEGDADSPGMKLAATHGVEVAPFFLLVGDDGQTTVYTSTLRFVREGFKPPAPAAAPQAPPDDVDWDALEASMAERAPMSILEWGLERYGERCAIAFSGAEDVVLIDMAARTGLPFSVFCLDTGRLHPETYAFIEQVRKHYAIEIQLMTPKHDALQAFVREKGLFSFREDGHKECCGVRKIEPLKRALGQFQAWVTGQRRDQSPATRGDLRVLHLDDAFQGKDGPLVKLNPLTHWSSKKVWGYIRANGVPYNPLHERGFISIGCEPCTRAILPGEHERAGRWWWEESTKRECGLHVAEEG